MLGRIPEDRSTTRLIKWSSGTTSLAATFPRLARLQAHAIAQVGAIRQILAQGQLTPEQATALRESRTLISPYLLKTE